MGISMFIPIFVVVASNTIYNICAKSIPAGINSFASLAITYLIAAVTAIALFFATSENKNLFTELTQVNWASFVLGIAVVGLEFGFIYAYRVGWPVSTAQLVASVALTCVLITVGVFLYKEVLTVRQVVGMVVCLTGLILITK